MSTRGGGRSRREPAPPDAASAASAAGEADPGMGRSEGPDAELLDLIDHLGTLLERSDLAELEVEAGATSILLRRAEALAVPAASGPATPPAPGTVGGSKQGAPAAADPTGPRIHRVLAPLTGIFYAAPTPEASPFVDVGVEVVVGQVIGLIEAMKLFNEIKSDVAGRVQRVVAETGQLVKARDPLIEVAPRA